MDLKEIMKYDTFVVAGDTLNIIMVITINN